MPLDFANILATSQGLVPDLREQMMQDAAFRQQQTEWGQQNQLNQFATAQKQNQATRLEQFQRAVQVAVHSGDPRAIANVMIEFPEFAEQLKPGVTAVGSAGQQRNLTQKGAIYTRAINNDFTGAAKQLEARIAADKAAGVDTADDEEILAGLKSGDPHQQKIATATVGFSLAAETGDKFGETYKAVNPADKQSPFMIEYQDRVRQFGKEAADTWAETKNIEAGPPGGVIFDKRDYIRGGGAGPYTPSTSSRGGDPASTGGYDTGSYVVPVQGGKFGEGLGVSRDGGKRKHNGLDIQAPMGSPVTAIQPGQVIQVSSDPKSGTFVRVRHADGSTSSYSHLGSVAVKTGDAVGPGVHLGTVGTSGNATGPVLHLVIRDPNGNIVDPRAALGTRHGSGPVKVKSVQQANKLPAGTHYITPDGQEFVR